MSSKELAAEKRPTPAHWQPNEAWINNNAGVHSDILTELLIIHFMTAKLADSLRVIKAEECPKNVCFFVVLC